MDTEVKVNGDRIGKSKFDTFVWVRCPDCGYERWVEKQSSRRTLGRCVPCTRVSSNFKIRHAEGMIRCKPIQARNVSLAMAQPDVHERFVAGCRIGQIKRWQKSGEREKHSVCMQRPWKDEAYRDRMIKSMCSRLYTPEIRKAHSELITRLWNDPEWAKKMWESRKATPNKSELKLSSILQELALPYKFVGDGQIIIGGKCPDYINVNGQKKIIELFGDYWHDIDIVGHPIEEEIRQRIDFFSQFGFKTLIILDSELSDIESVKDKLIVFNGGA